MECQDCGIENESVKETIDPYMDEILEERVEIVVCVECLNERGMAL